MNPYLIEAGEELDRLIHQTVLGGKGQSPPVSYSTDESAASPVISGVKSRFGIKIVTGKTRIRQQPWFARYGSDPSTMTEVVAETLPLAVCRVSLLIALKFADEGAA